MNEYSICFQNGMSGRCNINCEQFRSGNCDVAIEMITEQEYALDEDELKELKELYGID